MLLVLTPQHGAAQTRKCAPASSNGKLPFCTSIQANETQHNSEIRNDAAVQIISLTNPGVPLGHTGESALLWVREQPGRWRKRARGGAYTHFWSLRLHHLSCFNKKKNPLKQDVLVLTEISQMTLFVSNMTVVFILFSNFSSDFLFHLKEPSVWYTCRSLLLQHALQAQKC